uniref:RING-type domain-containing protein n=1 Tax=Cucumis sativus TaxID=3659 RepID=A0A0A0LY13_CUCSA
MVSMFLPIVLLFFISIVCSKRFAKSDVEELPKNVDLEALVFHYNGDEGGEQEYAICLCEIEEGEKCRKMKTCGHVFHKDCIDRWFKVDDHCPICRTSVCVVVVDHGGNAMASSTSLPIPYMN